MREMREREKMWLEFVRIMRLRILILRRGRSWREYLMMTGMQKKKLEEKLNLHGGLLAKRITHHPNSNNNWCLSYGIEVLMLASTIQYILITRTSYHIQFFIFVDNESGVPWMYDLWNCICLFVWKGFLYQVCLLTYRWRDLNLFSSFFSMRMFIILSLLDLCIMENARIS